MYVIKGPWEIMYAFDKMIRRRYGILRRQKNETREKDKGQGNNST